MRYDQWKTTDPREREHEERPDPDESRCDNCGKPECFGVLCAECEELCCSECGYIGCGCDLPEAQP